MVKGKTMVSFDVTGMKSEPITVDNQYPGTRLSITAHLDTIVFPLTIDIGFGDVVVPSPVEIDYPLLLSGIPDIMLNAYSIEMVIAEKFHTMIVRDVNNSRMKDFFDCYILLTTNKLDESILFDAVKATFDNRGLLYNPDLQLFKPSFFKDMSRITRWEKFLRKIHWKEDVQFEDVMTVINNNLLHIYDKYWNDKKRNVGNDLQ